MSTATDNSLVFLDTEFTNLNPLHGDVIEAAWAVDDQPVQEVFFNHTLQGATQDALRINRYFERSLHLYCTDNVLPTSVVSARQGQVHALTQALMGNTIVAENYGIDVAVLLRKIGFEPWHYRKIELSTYAMSVFNLDRPQGLHFTKERLRDLGYTITENDHSARADVECLRECYNALRAERARLSYAPVAGA